MPVQGPRSSSRAGRYTMWPGAGTAGRPATEPATRLLGHVVGGRRAAGRDPLELGLHEGVQVAVQDGARAGRLVPGPEVLDHLVRVQDVGADLVAPARGHMLAAQPTELLLALLQLELEEPGLEHPDRELTVLGRGTLVLAGDHDARGQVGQADRRFGLLDVLSTGARAAERVHPDLVPVELDLDVVVGLGHDLDQRERGLAAVLGIVWRDPDQPMDAALGTQPAVGEPPGDGDRGALDPGLLP